MSDSKKKIIQMRQGRAHEVSIPCQRTIMSQNVLDYTSGHIHVKNFPGGHAPRSP